MQQMGVQLVRDKISWNEVEKKRGVYAWPESASWLQKVTAAGINCHRRFGLRQRDLRKAIARYKEQGFLMALDDMGVGFPISTASRSSSPIFSNSTEYSRDELRKNPMRLKFAASGL
jgi:hypothetical protein